MSTAPTNGNAPPTPPPLAPRLLPESEWARLIPLFADSFPDRALPIPPAASCAVVERDGEIVAAMFFVLAYHMEPFCARKGYGSTFNALARFLESQIESSGIVGYYVTAHRTSEAIKRERALGRTVLTDHVPAFRVLGTTEAALAHIDGSTGVESVTVD